MIVTSTHTIEGREVLRYFDPISATAVIGANALSEIGASFVDLFGGRSRNYENKVQELYKSVVESLKQNARSYRADAVIGFSVNIDEQRFKEQSILIVKIDIVYLVAFLYGDQPLCYLSNYAIFKLG